MKKVTKIKVNDRAAVDFHESLAPAMAAPGLTGLSLGQKAHPGLFGFNWAELLFALVLFGATLLIAGYLMPKPELVTVVPSDVTLSVPLGVASDRQLTLRARQAAASSSKYRDYQDTAGAASLQPAPGRLQTTAPSSLVQTSESGYTHQGSVGTAGR
ncbi:MAG TPA: hypothetical protein VK963_04885 [Candidatus Saccharimonadales bacterium]|nr:hypothetical protein [Candidatus Saccharimonadales bacterium]